MSVSKKKKSYIIAKKNYNLLERNQFKFNSITGFILFPGLFPHFS